jgi:hypothetical protein
MVTDHLADPCRITRPDMQTRRDGADRAHTLWKYAGELRVGDVWTERPQDRAAQTYRVMAIEPGLAPTTIRVTAASVTTGQQRTMDFFLVNRVEVREVMRPSDR